MASDSFSFGRFFLDPGDRRLMKDGLPVELNARYLDALILLLREAGRLVSKDRFLAEIWRGVPVTDKALTQCIRTLRRQLGDDAARPRYIETVPKHGYRFIAPIDANDDAAPPVTPIADAARDRRDAWRGAVAMAGAGTVGAGVAGIAGGLFYGVVGAAQPLGPASGPAMGGASVLLVLLTLTVVTAVTGGAGVSMGIAAVGLATARAWRIVGGAAGGLMTGGVVKLLGIDAFNLLLGRSPTGMTGAPEGLLLGASVGAGAWWAARLPTGRPIRHTVATAASFGAAGGIATVLTGGRLMGGSLAGLAHSFAGSRLSLDALGSLSGERNFGPIAQIATATGEGALFGGCIVGAMALARRRLDAAG